MKKICISNGWKFRHENGDYMDVDLPHDYMIASERLAHAPGERETGYYQYTKGIYAKHLTFEKGKHYMLNIDGAYMCSTVYLNENYLVNHPHGYTPYLVDLTDDIRTDGTNKLVITSMPLSGSARWYSGAGLYRDVFLWEGGDVRLEPWDMFVSTDKITAESARIKLQYTVTADRKANIKMRFSVLLDDDTIKTETASVCISEKSKTTHECFVEIQKPKLWDIDNPYLYTLKTEIFEDGILLDTSYNEFGIRTISADAENGLLLNGKAIKLRGGCIHHDHGVLGAAAFPAAERRKIRLLKEAGFNAVRTAHNPPSSALLAACDRLGMIVMDEVFDEWNKEKRPAGYRLWFEDWWKRDIANTVRRERNHPCVFSYSIGNEIFEIDGTSKAAQWSKALSDEIRKYDTTRFVTAGINKGFIRRSRPEKIDPADYAAFLEKKYEGLDFRDMALLTNEITAKFEEPLDIVGCNYYYESYLIEHECYPNRVIWGSETHALHFYDSWSLTRDNSYIIGDFTWTAYDNMGEEGAGRFLWARDGEIPGLSLGGFPWRNCYQGDLDLCGFRRPQSYYREAVWLGNKNFKIFTTHPEHYGEGFSGTEWHFYDVNQTWTFDDIYVGRPITAEVYTDADKVEWYINGRMVGESVPEKCVARIDTTYEKGNICAIAYKNGAEYAKASLHTTGQPTAINIVPEQSLFIADNRDLYYFDISIVDSEGRLISDAENELTCLVQGGELLGIYSANPCSEDCFTSNTCHAFKGRALAVVRTDRKGNVGVLVYGETLASGFAQVEAK